MDISILRDIRESLGLDPLDSSRDEEISSMSPDRQFELWCQWNGLLGWSETLKTTVLELFN